jgi:hypothetical protein
MKKAKNIIMMIMKATIRQFVAGKNAERRRMINTSYYCYFYLTNSLCNSIKWDEM